MSSDKTKENDMKTIGMTFEEMLEHWDAVVELMDPGIRDLLAADGYKTKAEFLEAYLAAHKSVWDEDFVVN